MNSMKTNHPVLEYCRASATGRKPARWGFRFRTAEGGILIESAKRFASKAQAERGFISLIKSVATNQYQVEYPQQATFRTVACENRRSNGTPLLQVRSSRRFYPGPSR